MSFDVDGRLHLDLGLLAFMLPFRLLPARNLSNMLGIRVPALP